MLKPERYLRIMELINDKGIVSTEELCKALNVSTATIRRDLVQMDIDKMLMRTHGGAVALTKTSNADVPISIRQHLQKGEKARIGAAAAELVKEGESIYIGAGTTTRELAARLGGFHHLTVLTNDIGVAYEIASNTDNSLIVAGGSLKKSSVTLAGFFTEQMLKELHVDMAFMAVDAVDIYAGFVDYSTDEALIKRTMLKNSGKCVMLVDHSKFQNHAFMSIFPLSDVDIVITSDDIDDSFKRHFEAEGIQLIFA